MNNHTGKAMRREPHNSGWARLCASVLYYAFHEYSSLCRAVEEQSLTKDSMIEIQARMESIERFLLDYDNPYVGFLEGCGHVFDTEMVKIVLRSYEGGELCPKTLGRISGSTAT